MYLEVEGFNGLVLYSFINTMEKVQTIPSLYNVLDFEVEDSNSLVLLTRADLEKNSVILRKYTFSTKTSNFENPVDFNLSQDVLQIRYVELLKI